MTGAAVRVEPRSIRVVSVLAVVIAALFVVAVGTGEYSIPPGKVIATLLGGGDAGSSFIIETLRLPRAITAVLVGGALGAAGAIFQSITRNPLGSPDIIGFTAGAAAAAVFTIVVVSGSTGVVAAGSLVGGVVTALLVYLLAYRGGVQGYRLVLVGLGVSLMLYAVVDYLLSRARIEDAQVAQVWLNGSLNGRGWEQVQPLALALVLLVPMLVALARPLRMMEMGDDAAKALGVPVERSRLAVSLVGVGMTAVAVSAAGPIAFVALAAPQIARRLTRVTGPGLGAAAAMGAALLLASDVFTQRVISSLPVGITTGVGGGIYLIWLLSREWRKGSR